eukprot:Phypoly_transcript_04202.p1 GENE.Phypoly_transcript_04202~~Phypoly_transcript_04202.p1  ORF type:complete len:204 (-),score=30.90 Phypoly_transcript_04202:652-1263(-)
MDAHLDPYNSPTFQSLIYVDALLSPLSSLLHIALSLTKSTSLLTQTLFSTYLALIKLLLPDTSTQKNISSGTSSSIANTTTNSTTLFYYIVVSAMSPPNKFSALQAPFNGLIFTTFLLVPSSTHFSTHLFHSIAVSTSLVVLVLHLSKLTFPPFLGSLMTVPFPPSNSSLLCDQSASCVYLSLSLTGAPQYIKWIIPPPWSHL